MSGLKTPSGLFQQLDQKKLTIEKAKKKDRPVLISSRHTSSVLKTTTDPILDLQEDEEIAASTNQKCCKAV